MTSNNYPRISRMCFLARVLLIFCTVATVPVASYAQISAHFTVSNHSGCSPVVANFTDSSTGHPVRWHWVFDSLSPGDTANSQNASWIYTTPGHYNVKLTVFDSTGASNTTTATNAIFVANQPVVRFTASDTILSCPPQTITFTNTSDTGGCSPAYTWYIDTSSSIHTKNATYTFTHSGNYDITLQESDACGCSGYLTKTAYVKIDTTATACYTASNPAPCSAPVNVCFTNCSSGATHYLWHFGDGDTSSAVNPCHIYTSPGNYTDTLAVSSGNGCVALLVKPAYIQVGHFSAGFYTTPASPVCLSTPVVMHDTTSGGTSHHWHFSSVASDTSNLAAPSRTYASAGTYTIKDSVWNAAGCNGSASATIVINPRPVVSFTATNTYRCSANDTVNFTSAITDASGIAQVLWHFGDAASGVNNTAYSDSTHIYTATGYYTPIVTVTDANGCVTKDSIVNEINVHPPVVTLSVLSDSGCIPYPIHYRTTISPVVAYITDSVTFGDGSSLATTDSGTHIYTTSGHFTIHHYYHLSTGCSYSDSVKVLVGSHASYSATVTPDSVCQFAPVQFAGNCTNCTYESWNTSLSTIHKDSTVASYTSYGVKSVTYIANYSGCVDTLKDTVFVFTPSAIFTYTVASCSSPLTYSFLNTSYGAANFFWKFGDGDTSTLRSPVHTYSAYGTYTVVLTDMDSTGHGCTNADSIVISIAPFAGTFSTINTIACKGQGVPFVGPLTATGAKFNKYNWYFGNGSTFASTTSNTATATYNATGVYSDTLIIKNAAACLDTIVRTAYVAVITPGGGTTVTPSLGCAPLTVNFHDADTTYPGGSITKRHWIWNVGTAAVKGYGTDTSHIYTEGIYHAVLIDTDNIGCVVRDTMLVTAVKPHAYFTTVDTVSCSNVPIPFTDTNTHVSYTWYFGDGTGAITSTGPDTTHLYTASGIYSDTIVITSLAGGPIIAGCIDTYSHSSYVNIHAGSIHVGFDMSATSANCPPLIGLATNTTTSLDNYTYQWKLGTDSTTIDATSDNFLYHYPYPGIYNITLIATSSLGCKDSLKKQDTVHGPTGTIVITPDSGCIGQSVFLHLVSTSAGILDTPYSWFTPPYGVHNTDTPGIVQTYVDPGSWNPYVVIQQGGCYVTVPTVDSIRIFAPLVGVNQPSLICRYGTDTLTATGLADYTWSPGYGLSCTNCAVTYANPLVTTTYTVTGHNVHTCVNSAITTVLVDAPPSISFTGPGRICNGFCATLSASGVAAPFTWSPAAVISCGNCDTITTCPTATQLYTFTGIDTNHCVDSGVYQVIVDTLPVVSAIIATPIICIGSGDTLTASGALSYNWAPAAALSCPACAVTITSVTATTTYTVTGTDFYGCTGTDTATLTVKQLSITGIISGPSSACTGVPVPLSDTATGGTWISTNNALATINSAGIVMPLEIGTDTIKYTFLNECGSSNTFFPLVIYTGPGVQLTTHSPSVMCSNTQYQNFGAGAAPDSGVTYTWAAGNATVYAVGANDQYSLITFSDTGKSLVTLTAETITTGCKSIDSFSATIGQGISPEPQIIFYAPNELVCLDNTADSYQWGYDDKLTLDSTLIPGAVTQDYFISAPDFTNKFYWVITDHSGCMQKSYFNAPTAIAATAGNNVEILLYPNPADDKINIEVKGIGSTDKIALKLYNMLGSVIFSGAINNGGGALALSKIPAGVYTIVFSNNGVLAGTRTFVKN